MKKQSILSYIGIPGSISLMSLTCGWIAIILLLQRLPNLAIISAVCAFFLDCLDGYVARKLKKESEFGRQLDSSIDFFNYSVFSALLFYLYIEPNLIGIGLGLLILSSGMLRLIRFNIEGFVRKGNDVYYAGIVVCHVSLTAAVLFFFHQWYPHVVSIIAPFVMSIVSLLQVSRILIKKTNTYHIWFTLALLVLIVAITLQLWHT